MSLTLSSFELSKLFNFEGFIYRFTFSLNLLFDCMALASQTVKLKNIGKVLIRWLVYYDSGNRSCWLFFFYLPFLKC